MFILTVFGMALYHNLNLHKLKERFFIIRYSYILGGISTIGFSINVLCTCCRVAVWRLVFYDNNVWTSVFLSFTYIREVLTGYSENVIDNILINILLSYIFLSYFCFSRTLHKLINEIICLSILCYFHSYSQILRMYIHVIESDAYPFIIYYK